MTSNIRCLRCGKDGVQIDAPPFRDELGSRIHERICRACWDEWLQRQMQLINHYALDLRAAEAREFLRRSAREFLFGTGDEPRQDGGEGSES